MKKKSNDIGDDIEHFASFIKFNILRLDGFLKDASSANVQCAGNLK